MLKRITFSLTIFMLIVSSQAFACDCDSKGNFLTVAPKSKLVALVKVKRYLTFKNIYEPTPVSMEVEIIEIYKGHETRRIVKVWGDNGALCRPYLSTFDIGKYYVIAFNAGSGASETNGNKTEKKTDYSISSCGDYWLGVNKEKQVALGAVAKNQDKILLAELRKKF